jgi:hypothetical protein
MLTEDDIRKLIVTLDAATKTLKLLRKGKISPKDESLDDMIGEYVEVSKAAKQKLQKPE